MKKIIIISVVVLLIAGGGAAAFFLLKDDAAAPGVQAAGTEGAAVEEPQGDPIYLALDPAFVVNFQHDGAIRYLQLSLQVMAYQQSVIDKVAANMPAVRNTLILLFSSQDYNTLNTLEGKEDLRKSVVSAINQQVRLDAGNKVSDVFFTGFVIQ